LKASSRRRNKIKSLLSLRGACSQATKQSLVKLLNCLKMGNQDKIYLIGDKLTRCDLKCDGIVNKPVEGRTPRCLFYEKRDSSRAGVIIIGINAGKSGKDERKYYGRNYSYKVLLNYWDLKLKNLAYYRKSRKIITELGFKGDILWTDLAKCECEGKNGDVPIQTLRICIDRFLDKEIKALPNNFVIIALGNIAFNFCALRFPNYFVVGLPHPTGAWGTYKRLMDNIKSNKKKYITELAKKKDKYGYFRAIKFFN